MQKKGYSFLNTIAYHSSFFMFSCVLFFVAQCFLFLIICYTFFMWQKEKKRRSGKEDSYERQLFSCYCSGVLLFNTNNSNKPSVFKEALTTNNFLFQRIQRKAVRKEMVFFFFFFEEFNGVLLLVSRIQRKEKKKTAEQHHFFE